MVEIVARVWMSAGSALTGPSMRLRNSVSISPTAITTTRTNTMTTMSTMTTTMTAITTMTTLNGTKTTGSAALITSVGSAQIDAPIVQSRVRCPQLASASNRTSLRRTIQRQYRSTSVNFAD